MSIELACPNCRKRLKAPPGAEGKRFKCPHCQEIVIVPGAASDGSSISVSGSSNLAPLYSSGGASGKIGGSGGSGGSGGEAKGVVPPAERAERWYVKTSAGADYGPISREELDRWSSEDRLDSESQILREGAGQWQWASDLYPRLYPTNIATKSAAEASDSTASDMGDAKAPAQRNERPADESDPYAATGAYDLTAMSPKSETAAFEQPALAEPVPLAGAATYAVTPPPEPSVPLPTREPSFDLSQPSSSSKYSIEMLPSEKSKTTAGVLGILFGGLGVHRFYLGDVPIGVAQALVTLATCGIGAWWGVFEGVMILIGQIDRDAQGRKLRD